MATTRTTSARRSSGKGVAPKISDEAVAAKTGKTWSRWFALLDREGGRKKSHRDIVAVLSKRFDVGPWWQQMIAVLDQPERHVTLQRQPLRLNRMGVRVEPGSSEPADELELAELCIGDELRATITLVRIPRAEMPPPRDWLGQAERAL